MCIINLCHYFNIWFYILLCCVVNLRHLRLALMSFDVVTVLHIAYIIVEYAELKIINKAGEKLLMEIPVWGEKGCDLSLDLQSYADRLKEKLLQIWSITLLLDDIGGVWFNFFVYKTVVMILRGVWQSESAVEKYWRYLERWSIIKVWRLKSYGVIWRSIL